MQLESLLEPFENQLNLPSCSIELNDIRSRPLLLWQGCHQQHDSAPPCRSYAVLGTMFAPDVLSFAFSRLHRLLAWQDLDDQTYFETLFMFGVPDPDGPFCHCSIALMLDQPFKVDLFAIFPFKPYVVVTDSMDSKCSLLLALLHTCSHRIACISYNDIACLQIKMMQSFGSVTIAYLNMG